MEWEKLLDGNGENPEDEFPDEYVIKDDIKSPLNVLYYNMNFEFKDNYPAKMSPDFARDMIKIYSKKGEVVWDGCCGSGVVPRMASELGRESIGTDINPKAIDLCVRHEVGTVYDSIYQVADVRTYKPVPQIDLVLSSFPFGLSIGGDKNHYSDEKEDLGASESWDMFFDKVTAAVKNYYDVLKPGGVMILDARDRTKNGVYYDTINYFRNSAFEAGFKMLCRYTYFLMPWSHYTFMNKPSGKAVPMISTMDAIVMVKPKQEPLA